MPSFAGVTPQFPITQKQVEIQVTLDVDATHLQLKAVSAPPGSAQRSAIDATGGPASIHSGVGGVYKFVPTKSGRYEFEATSLKFSGALVPVGSPTTFAIHVMSKVEVDIKPSVAAGDPLGNHRCKLTLYISDDAVKQTTTASHGVNTPALTNPTTPEAGMAIDDPAVKAAVAAMVVTGVANVESTLNDLITAWTTRISAPSPTAPTTANAGAFKLVEAFGGRVVD